MILAKNRTVALEKTLHKEGSDMPTDSAQPKASFVTLTPAQHDCYMQIRELVGDITEKPHGLTLLLNAIALTAVDGLITMDAWTNAIMEEGWDQRDLSGIICDRPLGLPKFGE